MSSAVVSTSAALGRPFLFDADVEEQPCHPGRSGKGVKRVSRGGEEPALSLPQGSPPDPRLASVTPASRLAIRPAPEMVTSGIPALDALTGGLPRGCLTEIYGTASSGRTSVMLAALAAATGRGEYCAVIDSSDTLDPHSLAAAGIDLDRLLWVRCQENSPQRPRDKATPKDRKQELFRQTRFSFDEKKARASENRLEQVLRATDLLLESGGFGLILLDLADIPHQSARRIPLTTWFRFRRAVEHKPTILLALEQQPIAGSCAALQLKLGSERFSRQAVIPHLSDSSRKAAAWENLARQCRGGMGSENESRRDVTLDSNPTVDDSASPMIAPSHTHLLTELEIRAELVRSRLDRKPARSAAFETKTAWAG